MPKLVKFQQKDLIADYEDSKWHLNQEGVCWGLSVDFYRFYKKVNDRIKEKKISSEDLEDTTFLYKHDLRKYIEEDNIPKYNKIRQKAEKSFARRVQFYQLFPRKYTPIDEGDIQDFQSFDKALKETDYLAVEVSGSKGAHAIPIVALRDEKNNILGYRLLEPNVGEYRNIKTIDELDTIFKDLMVKQPKYTNFAIADYNKIFQDYELVTSKQMFYSLDKMQKLESLNKEQLTEIFQRLFDKGLSAADICKLIPQDPKVMRHILQEAGDLLLSSSDIVYPILEFAIKNQEKDKDLLNDLLLNQPNILNVKDNEGNTLLHLAAQKNNPEIMKTLILGMTPNQIAMQNKYGNTALHIMIQKGATESAGFLILSDKMVADKLAIQNNEGNTALHLAVVEGYEEIAQAFIRSGMDLGIKEEDGLTALHIAILAGHKNIADSLIGKMTSDQLAIQDEEGCTALHLAIKEDQIDIAESLVRQMSKEACALPDEEGNTALHLALKEGDIKVASNIIWKGLNSDQLAMQDGMGRTVLHYAAVKGYKGLTETLIYKMDPKHLNLQDKEGNTALHLAAANGHMNIVEQLLNEDVPHHENFKGETPLDMAKTKEMRTILLLSQYGKDPCNLMDRVIEFNKKLATSSMQDHDIFDKDMIVEYLNQPVDSNSVHISDTDEDAGYIAITSDEERPKTPRSDSDSEDEKRLTKLDVILRLDETKNIKDQEKIIERKKVTLQYCTNIDHNSTKTQTLLPQHTTQQTRTNSVY